MTESRRNFLKISAGGFFLGGAWAIGKSAHGESEPPSHVDAVRFLGDQFRDNPVGVTGQDGATSIVLPSGDALWLFGDTIEGPFESIRGLALDDKLSNTAAIVPAQDASAGIKRFRFLTQADGKRPRQIVPFAADEDPKVNRVWPIHGVCVGDQIYVFYHRISLIPGVDVFENFHLDGMGIARAKVGEWQFERLQAPDGTREFWKGDQPTFGVFVEQRDGYVYVWGSLMTGMFLARTRPERSPIWRAMNISLRHRRRAIRKWSHAGRKRSSRRLRCSIRCRTKCRPRTIGTSDVTRQFTRTCARTRSCCERPRRSSARGARRRSCFARSGSRIPT